MSGARRRVAVAWNGLPMYAAAMLRRAFDLWGEEATVIGTKPLVPAQGMDHVLRREVIWLADEYAGTSFGRIGASVPEVLFVSGWTVPAFLSLCREVKRKGGHVVVMVDNCYRGDLRQFVGAIAYRSFLGRLFDHVWVPGQSARRLMRYYGVHEDRITEGLYTCDTSVFTAQKPIGERPPRFTFVGQFSERKNVRRVHEAFRRYHADDGRAASLVMYGSGPLREALPEADALSVHDFASPAHLASAMNESRALVLASLSDHWPLVVHEAASCGCLLILSAAIGSRPELAGDKNAKIIRATSVPELVDAYRWAATLSDADLAAGSEESIRRASMFSLDHWAQTFGILCSRYLA